MNKRGTPQKRYYRLQLPLTASNEVEIYVAHFELLSQIQKWKRNQNLNSTENENDEWPNFFCVKATKLAFDFYRKLLEDTRKSYDETVRTFGKHYNEKPIVFRGRLARRVQQPGEF